MDDEFYLATPIRQDIEVLPADKPLTRKHSQRVILNSKGKLVVKTFRITLGFTVTEKIVIGVVKTIALNTLRKTTVIGVN